MSWLYVTRLGFCLQLLSLSAPKLRYLPGTDASHLRGDSYQSDQTEFHKKGLLHRKDLKIKTATEIDSRSDTVVG